MMANDLTVPHRPERAPDPAGNDGGRSGEQAVIERAVSGNDAALAQLLEKYGPIVRRSLHGRIPRRYRTLVTEDDVMQETYTKVFIDIGSFRGTRESFPNWLISIARNNLFDALKGLRAQRRDGLRKRVQGTGDNEWVALLDLVSDLGTTPGRAAVRREARVLVRRALEQLPDAYRVVVQEYDLKERGAAEVAAELDCTHGALFMRRARAHRMLRDLLENFSNYC